ncbi:hypothetical protein [Constantimarinum furrinae]|uniref:hypothetical protein n=1 Tax=Constantimarinum furrinae TaxID=2562285 RepID=UPI00164A77CC|nr:hypothetical protein [Constantimarinum furrinae]
MHKIKYIFSFILLFAALASCSPERLAGTNDAYGCCSDDEPYPPPPPPPPPGGD